MHDHGISETALLEGFPFPVVIVDCDMVFLDANQEWLSLFHADKTRLMGRSLFDAFPSPPEKTSQHEREARASVARVHATGVKEILPIGRHDIANARGITERRFWQVTNSRITLEDGHLAVLQVVREATAEVMAQKRVCTRERMASDLGNLAFWELNLATGELVRPMALDALHGLTERSLENGTAWLFEAMHPDDRDHVRARIEEVKARGEGMCRLAYRAVLPDGQIRRLVAQGEIVQNRDTDDPQFVGVTIDVTELQKQSDDLEAALAAHCLLLEDVNHRVKNSLQMVSSILQLEASRGGAEAREKLDAAAQRVRAIAMIHEGLGQGDGNTIAMDRHLEALCHDLVVSTGAELRGIGIEASADPVQLPSERAVTASLIVNELVTNALKHAFSDESGGSILVRLTRCGTNPANCHLEVRDTGTGGADMELRPTTGNTGLGQRLIRSSVTQLGGTIEQAKSSSGWHTTITFPL
jgi:PAS domain S-box-containing protein